MRFSFSLFTFSCPCIRHLLYANTYDTSAPSSLTKYPPATPDFVVISEKMAIFAHF